ncbi:phosphoribosylanthranilate isomerase [bacterium]|nr:phosphoribosylanthranilate isomerase [bacterium]
MSNTPLLKICGLTTIADLGHARRCGADFLGLVVERPGVARSVKLWQAERLARVAPRQTVAVVVSDHLDFLRQVAERLHPRALQIHSAHAASLASELRGLCPIWTAVGLPPRGEAAQAAEALEAIAAAATAGAEMIVLDTSVRGQTGGTGRTSDWEVAAEVVRRSPLPVLLAGGIGPDNAAEALARVRPAGLDASSRLEIAPGRKDPVAVRDLVRAVKA